MRVRLSGLAVLAAVALLLAACQAPTAWEKSAYESLVAQGAPLQETKDPVLAASLNILPGIGDAYNGEWGGFAVNLLTWPYSILWGVPEAGLTARNINMRETVYYYLAGPGKGRYEFGKPAPKE